jgi:ubiquinol-cytochrome c reductase cytochrome b subunit
VRSWIYVFGVATLAALLFVLGSGLVLILKGAAWWHT